MNLIEALPELYKGIILVEKEPTRKYEYLYKIMNDKLYYNEKEQTEGSWEPSSRSLDSFIHSKFELFIDKQQEIEEDIKHLINLSNALDFGVTIIESYVYCLKYPATRKWIDKKLKKLKEEANGK